MAEYRCSKGRLVIDDRNIQIVGPLKRILWTVPRTRIEGVAITREGVLQSTIVFQGPGGDYSIDGVPKKHAQEIIKMFQA